MQGPGFFDKLSGSENAKSNGGTTTFPKHYNNPAQLYNFFVRGLFLQCLRMIKAGHALRNFVQQIASSFPQLSRSVDKSGKMRIIKVIKLK